MTKELSGSPGQAGGLRKGFTTGTCAAAAARGAAEALASGVFPSWVTVSLPGGQVLTLPLAECSFTEKGARCAVRKDSGDDPDVTDGMLIFAEARFTGVPGVSLSGGPGIGRVTRKGLPVTPGQWAINPGPMRMIEAALEGLDLKGRGVEIALSAPEGEERAKKTWNPRLGSEGGISILGTTGIVEPKSEAAYLASIDLYIAAALAFDSQRPGAVFLIPGYVGEKCLLERFGAPRELMVSMGDHAGYALEKSAEEGARAIFLFAHASKGAKIAAGLFNTH
ncbi:MAG: cobalamin biosynthesis protein CbiD, partial [Synergistaceae bacterium]|nr:cobalamin biosynthesis protein CbiD [Synergistaceae bacterium]